MTYVALVHGAKGILFFSYWPQAARTWAEVGVLCRELHRIKPYFMLPSTGLATSCTDPEVQTRCVRIGNSGLVIAVNTAGKYTSGRVTVRGLPVATLSAPFENRRVTAREGAFDERFMPYEVHVYQWGETPQVEELRT